MNIKVHRGLEQIGGCITEISTATSRVFIDFGQNLPGNGEATTWEGYYTIPEQIAANPGYKNFRELFYNIVDIHTSGHADKTTIKRVIETINSKEVIVIHKEGD